jgi:polysaccharide export outer membrane protein
MQQFDRTVRVSLLITEALGHQASVIGAVSSPGRFDVTPGLRLADLIAAAGGPMRSEDDGLALTTADLSGARLVRDGEAVPISVPLAIQGDPLHNIRVRPGDTLYVPGELYRLVTVLGQVDSPQMFAHRPGMRLLQALAIAGGITRDGNWGDVRVIRGDHEHPRVYGSSVADIVDGRAPDVVLAPGDIVYVASAGHADLRDVMTSINAFLTTATTAAVATVPAVILSQP